MYLVGLLGRREMRTGLVWKTQRKRPLRRPTLRREYIFKMDLENDLYCLPNIVRVIKSRRMRWAGHGGGRRDVHTGFWWGNLRERDHLEDQGLDGRIILKLISKKWDGKAWTGSIWLRIGTDGGHL